MILSYKDQKINSKTILNLLQNDEGISKIHLYLKYSTPDFQLFKYFNQCWKEKEFDKVYCILQNYIFPFFQNMEITNFCFIKDVLQTFVEILKNNIFTCEVFQIVDSIIAKMPETIDIFFNNNNMLQDFLYINIKNYIKSFDSFEINDEKIGQIEFLFAVSINVIYNMCVSNKKILTLYEYKFLSLLIKVLRKCLYSKQNIEEYDYKIEKQIIFCINSIFLYPPTSAINNSNDYIPIFELFYTILEKKIKLLLFTVSEMLIDILEEKNDFLLILYNLNFYHIVISNLLELCFYEFEKNNEYLLIDSNIAISFLNFIHESLSFEEYEMETKAIAQNICIDALYRSIVLKIIFDLDYKENIPNIDSLLKSTFYVLSDIIVINENYPISLCNNINEVYQFVSYKGSMHLKESFDIFSLYLILYSNSFNFYEIISQEFIKFFFYDIESTNSSFISQILIQTIYHIFDQLISHPNYISTNSQIETLIKEIIPQTIDCLKSNDEVSHSVQTIDELYHQNFHYFIS